MTDDRHARHRSLPAFGSDAVDRLQNTRALIVGLGGTGAAAAASLGAAGVDTLLLNDFDRVDASNLARQNLYTPDDIGQTKTAAAARRIKQQNPALSIVQLCERLDANALTDLLQHVDIVLDCCDNFASRFVINRVAHATRTPLVTGAAIRWEGQVAVFPFNDEPSPCYQCLYQPEDESLEDCAGAGVIAPLPPMIGQLMALEAIKCLTSTGTLTRLLVFDAQVGAWKSLSVGRRDDCPVCAAHAASA
ncbi:MAG: HesA/MoeB/ThiF family protein [Pseudomonadota bacterium]